MNCKWKLFTILHSILDDRARSSDLICLIILIELYTSLLITPYIYGLIFIKQISMFTITIFRVVKKVAGMIQIRLDHPLELLQMCLHKLDPLVLL